MITAYSYSFTSDKLDGEIILHYNEHYLLLSMEIKAMLTEEQHLWFLRRIPREFSELVQLAKTNPQIRLSLINAEITFEMFWNKYNEKALSNKKRSEAIWKKMKKIEQRKAFYFIHKYITLLPAGVRKKYAENYLSSELWNN